jgi:putative membrane protein
MRRVSLFVWAAAALAAFPVGAATARPPSFAASAAADARPLSLPQRLERRFLQISASNLRFESDASRLALARSSNPAVKDLANSLLAHQQTAQPELLRLLHVRGMAMPILSSEHGKVLKRLGKLSGAKFDRMYVDEVVVKTYQVDLANFGRMAADAQDPVLKAWVERQLPALRFNSAKAEKALPNSSLKGQRAV